MRRTLWPILALAFIAAPPQSLAQPDPATLVKERGCTNCHDVSNYKVGPPFKSVAVKYRADRAAGEKRITSVLKDGVGHPKTNLTAEEIQAVAQWVLDM
jgi:cytochrome c551/c552